VTSGGPWPAPAKLNLFLHVTGRREDGYHTLQTLFQILDACDWLSFAERDDGRIVRQAGAAGVTEESDLAVRAALALQQQSGTGRGVTINVDKRLPMGGGLGGGSSDAATVLVALNAIWGLGLETETLAGIGLELGADVPVFVHGRTAWAEGVGEHLEPVETGASWYLVACPDCHVSTREIFEAPELTRNSPPITIRAFLSGQGRNDCEPVVRERFSRVAEALDWLAERTGQARMTGTGGCVFTRCESEGAVRTLFEQLPPGMPGIVARACDRSPLLDRLDRYSETGL